MSIDEAIEEMRRAAEVNLERAERCRYANSMQPSLYDVEAGVQYSKDAEKYRQIAEWLDDYRNIKLLIPIEQALQRERNKAIEDCAYVVSEFLDCRCCPVDCRGYTTNCCKDAIKMYLQEKLKEDK